MNDKKDSATPDAFTLAGKTFRSRLLIGTARYPNNHVMLEAIEAIMTEAR